MQFNLWIWYKKFIVRCCWRCEGFNAKFLEVGVCAWFRILSTYDKYVFEYSEYWLVYWNSQAGHIVRYSLAMRCPIVIRAWPIHSLPVPCLPIYYLVCINMIFLILFKIGSLKLYFKINIGIVWMVHFSYSYSYVTFIAL